MKYIGLYSDAPEEIIVPYQLLKNNLFNPKEEKTYLVRIPQGIDVDTTILDYWYETTNHRLLVLYSEFKPKKHEAPFFFTYAARTFADVAYLKNLGACRVCIDAPLTFQLDKLRERKKKYNVMFCANHQNIIHHINPICSWWIRPEDIKYYEDIIDYIILTAETREQEETLYRIYAHDHEWQGKVRYIIPDLSPAGDQVDNQMIPQDFGVARANCGQKCLYAENSCGICKKSFILANTSFYSIVENKNI